MTKQQIAALLKYAKFTQRTTLHIIKNSFLVNKQINHTDLDSFLVMDCDLDYSEPMKIDISILSKSKDISLSIKEQENNEYENDFPVAPEQEPISNINPLAFNENLNPFVKYCDNDHRKPLDCVFFSKDNQEIVAIDGQRLFSQKIAKENYIEEDVTIPKHYIEILEALKKISPLSKLSKTNIYYIFEGIGWKFFIKNIQDDYQYIDYKKVIPVNEDKITISKEFKMELVSALTKIIPFTNKKTNFCVIKDNWLLVRNTDENNCVKIELSQKLNHFYLGMNAGYLIDILKDLDDDDFVYSYKTAISAIIFEQKTKTLLLMPLRIMEWDEEDIQTFTIIKNEQKQKTITKQKLSKFFK